MQRGKKQGPQTEVEPSFPLQKEPQTLLPQRLGLVQRTRLCQGPGARVSAGRSHPKGTVWAPRFILLFLLLYWV